MSSRRQCDASTSHVNASRRFLYPLTISKNRSLKQLNASWNIHWQYSILFKYSDRPSPSTWVPRHHWKSCECFMICRSLTTVTRLLFQSLLYCVNILYDHLSRVHIKHYYNMAPVWLLVKVIGYYLQKVLFYASVAQSSPSRHHRSQLLLIVVELDERVKRSIDILYSYLWIKNKYVRCVWPWQWSTTWISIPKFCAHRVF